MTVNEFVTLLRSYDATSLKPSNKRIIELFHVAADLIESMAAEMDTIAIVHLRDPKDIAEIARLKGESDGSN